MLSIVSQPARAVCDALTWLDSADTDSDWESDMSRLEKALEIYWSKHDSPTIKCRLREFSTAILTPTPLYPLSPGATLRP